MFWSVTRDRGVSKKLLTVALRYLGTTPNKHTLLTPPRESPLAAAWPLSPEDASHPKGPLSGEISCTNSFHNRTFPKACGKITVFASKFTK